MAALTDIIDLLLKLLRDPVAQEQFEQNPQATLQSHGLDGISGDDVRDARLLLADRGDVRSTSDAAAPSRSGGDAVREIQYTTTSYEATDSGGGNHAPSYTFIDDRDTNINIDDRDIDIDASDDDITIVDASDDDVTNIDDSFNQDNDQVTAINESFNENTEVTAINESFNSDDDIDVTAIDVDDSAGDTDPAVTTTADDLAGDPDPRVTTTADDLAGDEPADEVPDETVEPVL